MTYKELKREVEALGFDESIANEHSLAIFANRALRRIFTDRCVTKTLKLYARDNKPNIIAENVVYKGSEIKFSLGGGAYCIEVCGVGSFLIKSGDVVYERGFNNDGKCYKDFIESGSTVTFRGSHSYLIRRVATFSHTFGSSLDSIPNADGRVEINVAGRVGDFLCFTGLPTDKSGSPITPISMADGIITLPDSFVGDFFISYLRMPRIISEIMPDEEIDIGVDTAHLLPLLCASYIYLECDAAQAEYYAQLYEKELKAVLNSAKRSVGTNYVDVLRWA